VLPKGLLAMYRSFVYLEIRVLLSAVPGVFLETSASSGRKDILSAKSEFLKRNNSRSAPAEVGIQSSALHKVAVFADAVGGRMLPHTVLERLTGAVPEPPDDRNFTGFSVKVAEGGSLAIMFHRKAKRIYIEEIRIEEDCGRLTRTGGKKARMDWTYAGCPVMRIRTGSVFELGEEAELFLQELYTLLSYLNLTTAEAGESGVRCNAYVALAEYPSEPDTFVKLRNLNSFNFVRDAVNSELSRQEGILTSGGKVAGESRLWNALQHSTESWKARGGHLVRFEKIMPQVTIVLPEYQSASGGGVELPAVRRERLRKQYGLSRLRSVFICGEKDRADYFEESVAAGAEPLLAAHWMAGELMRLLNRQTLSIKQCRLTPAKFSHIMQLLAAGKIHSGMAKTLMQTVCASGGDVEALVKKQGFVLLSGREELEPYVSKVLQENRKSVSLLQNGDMAPLEYLTGCVMKETAGRAVPQVVKSLIKEELHISVIYVLTMGGAITAHKYPDGTVAAGSAENVASLLDESNGSFPVQITPVRSMLSEETEPADWAELIARIKERMESGTANGIVVTHGTDTLPYTAALMFWLFSSADVPVVLTAASSIPSEGSEAAENLNLAVRTAREKKNGVYVAYDGTLYSPLNLKFLTPSRTGFVNWNMEHPVFTGGGLVSQQFMSVMQPESRVMAQLLNEAADMLAVISLYPGMPASRLERLLSRDYGIGTVILELYASGTGNMRNSDYSLKPFLLAGRRRGIRFYCTSQQECAVDFSEYTTSARVWREGAVPMGRLTTESVTALYFAASLIADNSGELISIMEAAAEYAEE